MIELSLATLIVACVVSIVAAARVLRLVGRSALGLSIMLVAQCVAVIGWLTSCTLAAVAHVAGRMAVAFEMKEPPPDLRDRLLRDHLGGRPQLDTGRTGYHSRPRVVRLLGPIVEAAGYFTGILLAFVLPLCDVLRIRVQWCDRFDRFRYASWLRDQLPEIRR